jgi:hypothetical protein
LEWAPEGLVNASTAKTGAAKASKPIVIEKTTKHNDIATTTTTTTTTTATTTTTDSNVDDSTATTTTTTTTQDESNDNATSRTLFVSNLSFETEQKTLEKLCRKKLSRYAYIYEKKQMY